ncbi:MAG TPA: ComEC/Rec2 family competence protein [Armatimonadota bacterium]|jgi:competence protein ComEC
MLIAGLQKLTRIAFLLSLILIVCGVSVYASRHRNKGEFRAVFLDVGQGDCTFLTTPSGHTVLVDGGGKNADTADESVGTKIVEPFLRSQGVNRIDLVIITHPHDDHLQGLIPVVRDFRIGQVLDSAQTTGLASYTRLLSTIRRKNIKYRRAFRGQSIDFGDGVRARVLNPAISLFNGTHDDANNNSVVLRFSYGRSSLMLMGDVESEAENEIVRSGIGVHSDVIKIGHHGSAFSTSDECLDAVHPKAAVISVGRHNQFDHPSKRTLERLKARGIRVFRTDKDGAMAVIFTTEGFKTRVGKFIK